MKKKQQSHHLDENRISMIDAQTSFMSNKSRFSLKNEYTFRHVHLREISIGYATRSE